MILEFENELGDIRSVVAADRQYAPIVRPLVTGDKAPLTSQTELTDDKQLPVMLPGFANEQPVVVSFYCPCWGGYARPYLQQLIGLAEQLRAEGATCWCFPTNPYNPCSVSSRS